MTDPEIAYIVIGAAIGAVAVAITAHRTSKQHPACTCAAQTQIQNGNIAAIESATTKLSLDSQRLRKDVDGLLARPAPPPKVLRIVAAPKPMARKAKRR